MEKMIGENISFYSSENNVPCKGTINAIIITSDGITYKATINNNDILTKLEYLNECYDHRKFPNEVFIKNNKDITDDFTFI